MKWLITVNFYQPPPQEFFNKWSEIERQISQFFVFSPNGVEKMNYSVQPDIRRLYQFLTIPATIKHINVQNA